MIGKSQQIKHSFFYLSSILIGNAFAFITLPIFTRLLTPQDYGAFALVQVYVVFVGGVINFGLPTIYERNFFQYKEEKERVELFYSILLFVVFLFIVAGFITFNARFFLSEIFTRSPKYANLLFIAFCIGGVTSIKTYFLIYLKNTEQAKKYFFYLLDETILGTIASLLIVLLARRDMEGYALGQLLATTIVALSVAANFLRVTPPRISVSILLESLRMSVPFLPRILLGFAGTHIDKYVLGLVSSVGSVGVYSIGQRFAYLTFTFMTAIQNVFAPQVYRRMFDLGTEGGRSIGNYLLPFLYVSICVSLGVSLFSEELLSVFTTPEYVGGVPIVIILSLAYSLMFFGKLPQLLYKKKFLLSSTLWIFQSLLFFLFAILLVPRYEAVGAGLAFLFSVSLGGLIHFLISQRHYRIHWPYFRVSIVYIILFISSGWILFFHWYEYPYIIKLLIKCLTLLLMLYCGVRFNVLSRENLLIIRSLVFGALKR